METALTRPFALLTLMALVLLTALPATAQDSIYTGSLDDAQTDFTLEIVLSPGESLAVFARATSGTLDTLLTLLDSTGRAVIINDDRSLIDLNSAIGYTSAEGGSFTLVLSRATWRATQGNYELTVNIGDRAVLGTLATAAETISLSGPTETLETMNFRILYTREGQDATEQAHLDLVAETLEWVWQEEVVELGWPAPLLPMSSRIDVYLMDLIDDESEFGSILGVNHGDFAMGDNPSTPQVEAGASASIIRLENDYAELADEYAPETWLRATAAHEFHHSIQRGYDALEPMRWYMEATAEWITTLVVPEDDATFERVEENYLYPHICFGAFDFEYFWMMYGDWPFMAMLDLELGPEANFRLWDNIATYDGFESLERLAESYGTTLEDLLTEYRLRNLLRDYPFAERFGRVSVWASDTLGRTGTLTGYGMQELAANYVTVDLEPGRYQISLESQGAPLDLWAVGISNQVASIYRLGRAGVIDTSAHDEMYLMVFNQSYDDDLTQCNYTVYTLDVEAAPEAAPSALTEKRQVPYFRTPD
jgi:hypothetical protein